MKKIIFGGSLAFFAVALSLGFTKHLISSKKPPALYWFEVNPGYGANGLFTTSEVTFISGPSADAPAGTDCSGTGDYKCVVGFLPTEVDVTTDQLLPGSWADPGMGIYRDTE